MHVYIPQDVWYQFPSGVQVKDVGVYTDLDAPLEKINVHVRGGFIIPMQMPGPNLMIGRGNPFTLLVARSPLKNATGSLFWDDGDSLGEWIFLGHINHATLSFACRCHRNENLQLFGIFARFGESIDRREHYV